MSKVAVVGAGAVGTAIAYAAQIRGVCRQLALLDLNAAKVRAEVLDLNQDGDAVLADALAVDENRCVRVAC